MERNRPVILLAATIAVALVTSVLAYSWLKTKAKSQSAETVNVAVAAADLSWGTSLSAEMVKFVPFLRASLPDGYFTTEQAVANRVAITQIRANEPILESKLAPKDISTGGVAAVISPKKRAMAVKVDKVKGVSGFIHPGHRVDVLVSLARTGEKNHEPVTKTILQNILVLAVGTEAESKDKQKKPTQVDVITLEVSPEEAEILGLAAAEGKLLQLSLRNDEDTESVKTAGVNIPAMLATEVSANKPRPASVVYRDRPVPAEKPKQVAAVTVELIRGTSRDTVTFGGAK